MLRNHEREEGSGRLQMNTVTYGGMGRALHYVIEPFFTN